MRERETEIENHPSRCLPIPYNTQQYIPLRSPQPPNPIFSISVSLSHHTHPKSKYRYPLDFSLHFSPPTANPAQPVYNSLFNFLNKPNTTLPATQMPTNSRSKGIHKERAVHDLFIPALQSWRMEAFENTLTYSDFESYLIVRLDEMTSSFLKFRLGNHNHSASRHERAISELKATALALGDHRCWWRIQKLRAIKEARRLQEEQEEQEEA